MDLDQDRHNDTLIIGDLSGQLWALNLTDGQAYGNAPIYTVPGNIEEPIGAAVAVHGRGVVFGTGGVAGSSDQRQYALYKVEVSSEGGTLLWRFPLETGAKVWAPPLLDAQGDLIFTASHNFDPLLENLERTSGHLLALNKNGKLVTEKETSAAVVGGVVSLPELVITTALSGEVKQFGAASRLSGPAEDMGSVRILSWRQR
jgi:outer membrane protein assembly factor BamB